MVLVPQAEGATLEVRREADMLEYLCATGILASHVGLKVPVHGSLSGLSVTTGCVLNSIDALDDPRVNMPAVQATGLRSMLCVPLTDQAGCVAVLKVASTQVGAFTDEDANRLQILAHFLYVTISVSCQLAKVTSDVLAALDRLDSTSLTVQGRQQDMAEFVANVMTPGLVDQVSSRQEIELILQEQALDIVLQPVFDLQRNCIVGCEALTRFRHSKGHTPDWWFAAAHHVGLGLELELLAVRCALALLSQIPARLRMSVNAGPNVILSPEFLTLIRSSDPARITVELTEHEPVSDYAELKSVLNALRADGVMLSMDDTGSGYAGLTHLLELQPELIKLDRQMVVGVDSDPVRQALTKALVTFAAAIGSVVIAEGIERSQEADCLRALGIERVQGYLFGRPMAPADFASFAA